MLRFLTMIKSYLIAFGLLVVGLFTFYVMGRNKQHRSDVKKASDVVKSEIDRISKVATDNESKAKNNPASGPDSSADKLRDDWSEG